MRIGQCLRSSSAPLGKDTEASAHHPPKTEAVKVNTLRWRAFKITNLDRHRKRQLDGLAGIVTLQKVEKKGWHLSALGAALPQLVSYIVGDVARPSFVGVECDYPNGIVALTLNVWSGRALQEVSSTWQIRSCINVFGL